MPIILPRTFNSSKKSLLNAWIYAVSRGEKNHACTYATDFPTPSLGLSRFIPSLALP